MMLSYCNDLDFKLKIDHNKLSIAIIEIKTRISNPPCTLFFLHQHLLAHLMEYKQNTQGTVSLLVAYKDAQQTGIKCTSNCIGDDVFSF